MRYTTTLLAAGLLMGTMTLGAGGCGSKTEPTPTTEANAIAGKKADAERDRRLAGRIRLGDVMMPVAPIVMHEPRMDLFPQCQLKQAAEKKAGHEIPLCFNLQKRPASDIKTMRVEVYPLVTGQSIRMLAAHNQGAHFFVEPNGTPYQILDLMYAARRGDAYPGDEIRVISAARDSHQALAKALKTLFPKLNVLEMPAEPLPPPVPKKAAPVPAADATAAPPSTGDTTP